MARPGLPATHRDALVLPKPYDPADLTAMLAVMCERRR